ncbi:MAG: two-component regulator propeller domain-containing protein [Bacteroidia bacterium]
MIRYIALLAIYSLPWMIWGQDFSFRRIGLEEGLSQSSVMTIAQDEKGLLWFGTQDGLNRYDGYDFFILKNEPFDPTSLSHNHIRALAIDQQEILWVGTGGGGLNIYNSLNHSFKRLIYHPDDSLSLSNNFITQIYKDPFGQIWIGTQNGLNKVMIDGKNALSGEIRFKRLFYNESRPRSTYQANIQTIFMDHTHTLWVGTRSGLYSIPHQNQDSVKSWLTRRTDGGAYEGMMIYDMLEDGNQELLVCTPMGVFQFNRDERRFGSMPLPEILTSGNVHITSLALNKQNDLLMGVEGMEL